MSIVKHVPNINKYLDLDKPYISPSDHAHLGLSVPEIIFTYGSPKQKAKSLPRLARYAIGSVRQIIKSYKALYNQPSNPNKKISEKDLKDLKDLLKEMHIDDVGFTEVDLSYIFSDKKILYNQAIVLLMEMNPEIIKDAPSKPTEKEIFRTYYELNVAVNKVKEFLNKRGYNAEAGPALGGEANYPLLAQKAGMGALGKHGMLITDKFGPSLRLAAVYTDIENLPVSKENQHLWINDFCDKCNRCVRECPAEAIYKESIVFEDGSKQCIDYKKCAVPFSNNNGCTVCVKECVFFKEDYEKIKRSAQKSKI